MFEMLEIQKKSLFTWSLSLKGRNTHQTNKYTRAFPRLIISFNKIKQGNEYKVTGFCEQSEICTECLNFMKEK